MRNRNEIIREIQKCKADIEACKAEIEDLKDILDEQKYELEYLIDTRDFVTAQYTREIIGDVRSDLDFQYEEKDRLYYKKQRLYDELNAWKRAHSFGAHSA